MKNTTDYITEFDAIALRENKEEAIDFLKKLPKEAYKAFRKGLLKLDKLANGYEIIELEKGRFQYKANRTSEYRKILIFGAIAACTIKEMRHFKSRHFPLFDPDYESIIAHFRPTWLTAAVNRKIGNWRNFGSFVRLKEYQEKGYINEVDPEVRADFLRLEPIQRSRISDKNNKLARLDDELSEKEFNWIKADLYLLFEYDVAFGHNYNDNRGLWETTLKDWSEQGKIKRNQLIIWTFDTFHRPFNRQTASFFRRYLDALNLSSDEKLGFQDRYIEMLSNANPHHVSYALKEIKKIEKLADFNNEHLVENLEPILVSDSKGIVKNALMLLERTAKKKKGLALEICVTALLALVSEDSDIQKRVLSILEKIAPKDNEILSDELMIYFENIHPALQPNFQAFLGKSQEKTPIEAPKATFQIQTISILSDEFKIKTVENWEDWIYLAGAIYENKTPKIADVERLFEGAVLLYGKQSEEVLTRMMPLIKRIEKTRRSYWTNVHTLIGAFIKMIYWMLKTQPTQWITIKKHAASQFHDRSFKYNPVIKNLLYHRFLLYLKLVFRSDNLPVLSAPTHYHTWIDPAIFIKKINTYIQKNQMPVILDLAHALTRLNLEATKEASQQAQKMGGKLGEIIQFILGNREELSFNEDLTSIAYNKENIDIDWALMNFTGQPKAAAILYLNAFRTRFPDRKMTDFNTFEYENYFNTAEKGSYSWEAIQEKGHYKDSRGNPTQAYTNNKLIIKTASNNFPKPTSDLSILFLYQHLWLKETLFSIDIFNLEWLISLLPNNTETIFSFYNHHFSRFNADYDDVETNKSSRTALKTIIDFNLSLQEMGTLFLACATTYADKVSRGMATEVLIHLLNQNHLNLPLFSTDLGILANKGYGRLQRIVPCLQQVSEVSDYHAKAIQTMIETMAREFPTDYLPRNTKKLLELLLNLSLRNKQAIDTNNFKNQIVFWTKNAGLKKLIKQF